MHCLPSRCRPTPSSAVTTPIFLAPDAHRALALVPASNHNPLWKASRVPGRPGPRSGAAGKNRWHSDCARAGIYLERIAMADEPVYFEGGLRACKVFQRLRWVAGRNNVALKLTKGRGGMQRGVERRREASVSYCKGAGEPGILSPNPPTHGPQARAAELRGPARAHWVCQLRVDRRAKEAFCPQSKRARE